MEKCRRMKWLQCMSQCMSKSWIYCVLENTPAVLSLGKLCDENGYSYEWINGQKPHLILNGIRIQCNTENFVPIVVPGLSTSSSSSSHLLQDRRGIVLHLLRARLLHQPQQHQVTVRLDREDQSEIDPPPQCLCQVQMLMIERGNPLFAVNPITSKVTKPTKTSQKQIKRRP